MANNLISTDFINELKIKTNIVDWVSENQKLSAQGKSFRGVCPFCHSKNATFTVFPETQSFYCFACKTGGDLITYLMKINDISYPKAVEKIAQKVGISTEVKVTDPEKEIMKHAAEFYHFQLRNNPKAQKAIDVLHSWGLYGQQIVNLGLGFNDDGFRTFMSHMEKKHRYSCEMLEKHHLLMRNEKGTYYDKMRNSIIIPIITRKKQVVAFDFYSLTNNSYYRAPNTDEFNRSDYLYGYNIATQTKYKSVIIVSTYDDYFALYSKGITNVVYAFGFKTSDSQMELLKKYFKVILLLTPSEYNTTACRSFCRTNDMYCEHIELELNQTVRNYIYNNEENIKNIVSRFENILNQ